MTAWDCSAWVRTYGLFLEERLECFRNLKYDIDGERLTKTTPGINKVGRYLFLHHSFVSRGKIIVDLSFNQVHSRTRLLNGEELLNQLPALQQLLYRLIGCQVNFLTASEIFSLHLKFSYPTHIYILFLMFCGFYFLTA